MTNEAIIIVLVVLLMISTVIKLVLGKRIKAIPFFSILIVELMILVSIIILNGITKVFSWFCIALIALNIIDICHHWSGIKAAIKQHKKLGV